jgi:hypothetical protein
MDLNIMEELADQVYKRSTANDAQKQHKTHKIFGKWIIELDDAVHPQENEWFTMARLSDGDVLLRRRTPEQ